MNICKALRIAPPPAKTIIIKFLKEFIYFINFICNNSGIHHHSYNKKFAFTLPEGATHVATQKNKSRFAFTLAEVLITLGIIGVVAAMTLPTLINDKQNKELEAGFKKAYSILQTAFNKMSYDEGQIINNENYPSWNFVAKFKTYFQDTCKNYLDCNIKINNGDYKSYNNGHMELSWLDDGRIMLPDGMLIMIENPSNSGKLYITVDVNGLKKKPNRWGYDLFTFQVTNDGKLLPGGAKGTDMEAEEFCSISKTSIYNGFGCAYRAITESDYFKKLPK